jgi:hypothetical protein
MASMNRRDFLKITGAAGSALMLPESPAQAQSWTNEPEKGASLRLMRWKRFVEGDEKVWMENTKKFSDKYKVEVRVDSESFETSVRKPPWRRTSAVDPTSSSAGTTTRIFIRTSSCR